MCKLCPSVLDIDKFFLGVIFNLMTSQKVFFRIFFVVLGIIILVLVGGVYYYFFIHYKSPLEAPLEKSSTVIEEEWLPVTPILDRGFTPENKLEIAGVVLDWLEGQKDERGIYNIFLLFDTAGSKYRPVSSGTSGHIGIAPIWGRFKHYQATGDQNDLRILAIDLDTYTDRSKINSIQNDFWNCKLMLELWQSGSFSADQKEKIKDICWQSAYYYHPDLSLVTSKKLIDGRLRNVVETEIKDLELERVIDKSISFEASLSKDDDNFWFYYAPYSSDFVARYFWERDENDLKRAKFYFNKAVQIFVQKEELFGDKEICLLGIAAADLFNATQKRNYLDFSRFLFEKVIPKSKLPVCALFTQELFDITGDLQYQEAASKVVEILINRAFDFSQYGGYHVGDGGFRDIEGTGEVSSCKSIRENGLMVGLLVK